MRTLKTKRLTLRSEGMEDAEVLHRFLGCDMDMSKYTGWNPYRTLDSTREKIEQDLQNSDSSHFYSWIIESSEGVIGTIGAYDYDPQRNSIEIGYSIFKKAWGKGYATEALCPVIQYLFEERNISRIYGWSHIDNIASQKVLEKAGLKRIDMNPDAKGMAKDRVVYEIAATPTLKM